MTSREAEIQARLDAATPGPWEDTLESPDPNGEVDVVTHRLGPARYVVTIGTFAPDDAALIANAPADLAYLLARVATLEAQVAAVRELIPDDPDDDWEDDWTRGNNAAWRKILAALDSAATS